MVKLKILKKVWEEVEEFIITILAGFAAKIAVFILFILSSWIMGSNEEFGVLNEWDGLASTVTFYFFLVFGLIKYMSSVIIRMYYSIITHKITESAKIEATKNQLLDVSMEQLPGKSGEILEVKATQINEFDPSEEE